MWLNHEASVIQMWAAAATFRHLQGQVSHTTRIPVIYFEHELSCNGSESDYPYRIFGPLSARLQVMSCQVTRLRSLSLAD
jgi:hypothetical protein